MVHQRWNFGGPALVTFDPSGPRRFELPLSSSEARARYRGNLLVDVSNLDRER